MSTAEKKVVKFLKGWRGYNANESAGFPADQADVLIKAEVAEEVAAKGKRAAGTQSKPGGGGKQAVSGAAGDGSGTGAGAGSTPGTGSGDGSGAGAGAGSAADNDERP